MYQKFKIDKLPIILKFQKQDHQFLIDYYKLRYGKDIKSVRRRNGRSIPDEVLCPRCNAPHQYIYDNNGGKGQYQCKICAQTFSSAEIVKRSLVLKCPYCGHTLTPKKNRNHFKGHFFNKYSKKIFYPFLNKILWVIIP